MQILGLLGMYFDAVVVKVETFLLLFRFALAILCSVKQTSESSGFIPPKAVKIKLKKSRQTFILQKGLQKQTFHTLLLDVIKVNVHGTIKSQIKDRQCSVYLKLNLPTHCSIYQIFYYASRFCLFLFKTISIYSR